MEIPPYLTIELISEEDIDRIFDKVKLLRKYPEINTPWTALEEKIGIDKAEEYVRGWISLIHPAEVNAVLHHLDHILEDPHLNVRWYLQPISEKVTAEIRRTPPEKIPEALRELQMMFTPVIEVEPPFVPELVLPSVGPLPELRLPAFQERLAIPRAVTIRGFTRYDWKQLDGITILPREIPAGRAAAIFRFEDPTRIAIRWNAVRGRAGLIGRFLMEIYGLFKTYKRWSGWFHLMHPITFSVSVDGALSITPGKVFDLIWEVAPLGEAVSSITVRRIA